MEAEQKRTELIDKITTRIGYDEKWARSDFFCAQIFVWLTILASFFAAILTAAQAASALFLALLAAIPGTMIVIEKSFAFGKRARWHWEMVATLEGYKNKLIFQDADVGEVSILLSEFIKEMEKKFPIVSVNASLSDTSTKSDV
ncbi:hypothetical protein LOY28_14920 [Pseudomonas sp. B21-017]|uniref:hypothetical protein n=1 Tax=Pseudomonas sp. B21-017 TaxID=2895474 RepID=UPI00216105B8|nr:hypothetical protein [Pseudomonas sp. B21-017]UVM36040.1 hypothetical protein LOY28_14920 [Pseudomonas sp. B21-017]